MKAIVMAGGEGTRLRPLTDGRPKPMAELLGRPVLWYTVEHLKRYGIKDMCFTLRFLPEVIRDAFGDGEELVVNIEHRVETSPLGTAGSVRACRDFIGDEDVLVISGDAVCNFDLDALIRFHREKNADATLALYEHPEPTQFGLVITDEDGRITSFSEKPSWENVTTSMVNTGIYILSPKAVEMIPNEREYDFGKELFPRLLQEGGRLYGAVSQGYWCDIGSPEAYRRCCLDIVSGRTGIGLDAGEVSPGVWSRSELRDVTVRPPVYVGEGCRIAPGSILGPGAVISAGSKIGAGTRIKDSVINGAQIGAACRVEGAIAGRGAVIHDGAQIGRECVIGDGADIGARCVLEPGVRIWTNRRTEDGRRISKSVTADTPEAKARFVKDHILKSRPRTALTPETAVALGAVLGKRGRVGVSYTGGETARLTADAISCGVSAAGGEICGLDCDFEAQLAAMGRLFSLQSSVLVREQGDELTVTFFEGSGVAAGAALRRQLEAALLGGRLAGNGSVGGVTNISGAARVYLSGVTDEIKALCAVTGKVSAAVTGSGAENRAVRCVLAGLGHEVTDAPGIASFTAQTGGFELICRDERGRELDATHTAALSAECAMRLGVEEIAAPKWLPEAVGRLARRYGCRMVDAGSPEGAALYAKQRFLRDACVEAALIVTAMARDGAELSRLIDNLPPFVTEKSRVEIKCSRAKAMRRFADARSEFAAELTGGLRMTDSRGTARVSPSFDGSALVLRAEAGSEEDARAMLKDLERWAGEIDGA